MSAPDAVIVPAVVKPAWIQFTAPEVDADIDLIRPRDDPDFDAWASALVEGHCPQCVEDGLPGRLGVVCHRASGEEWLVCPRGGWWLLAWPWYARAGHDPPAEG